MRKQKSSEQLEERALFWRNTQKKKTNILAKSRKSNNSKRGNLRFCELDKQEIEKRERERERERERHTQTDRQINS